MALGRTAATGRAAAARTYTLADLPGLKWWIEPDGINATASSIDSWTDKSGNGNTISETGTNRPTLVTSVLDGFNGAQVVMATNQRLKRANTNLITGRAFSLGLVMRVDALPGTSNDVFFANEDVAVGGIEFARIGATNKFSPSYFGGSAHPSTTTLTTGGFHLFTFRTNGTDFGILRYDRAVNVMTTTSTDFINPGAAASLVLGARSNNGLPASATFCAAYFCNGFLSDEQNRFAEDYFKAKFPSLA